MNKMPEGARSTMRLDSESDFEQGMMIEVKKAFGGSLPIYLKGGI